MVVVQGNNDPTLAANSARLATFVRAASENAHAALKRSYKHLGGKLHHSRLDSIGQTTLNYYNNRYGMNYGPEWAEAAKVLIEVLVTSGHFNADHPKFPR